MLTMTTIKRRKRQKLDYRILDVKFHFL